MKIVDPQGATPLSAEELEELIPLGVLTREGLNEVEEANILSATTWAFSRKHNDYLSSTFIQKLHKRMFDQVWRWAGIFRTSNKNLGVDKSAISSTLRNLLDDTKYWIEKQTYPMTELGARFHHRLVSVHCFPNGNGRHARLMTDVLMKQNHHEPFSWGSSNLNVRNQARANYLEALRKADRQDYAALIAFVRS